MDPLITGVAISLVSYHLHKEADVRYHQFNPGIFVELNHEYVLGAYHNSFGKPTLLAAYNFRIAEVYGVKFSGLVGPCTGYHTPVCAAGIIRWNRFILMATPPVRRGASAIGLAIQLDY